MKYGQLCKSCPGDEKCQEMPGKNIAVDIQCVVCNGLNFDKCDYCGKTGAIEIKDCPEKIITSDIWMIMELAKLYAKGLPPVAGGVLDQAHNFIEAVNYIFSEEYKLKAQLGLLE